MDLLVLTLVLLSTMCWGLAQVIGKLALKNIGALLFNAVRFSFASTIVIFGILLIGGAGDFGSNWPVMVAILSTVLGQFFATHLFFYSIKREAAHRIIPVGNTQSFWAIAFASIFLAEEVSPILLITAVLIVVGSFLLVPRNAKHKHWRAGILVAATAACFWGLSIALFKYCFNAGMSVSTLLLIRVLLAAALFNTALGISSRGGPSKIHRRSIGLSVISGIAFLVGTLMYMVALSVEQASTLAPITGSTILFGFLFSILFVGERPTRKSILGAIIIFLGILLIAV